MRLTDAVFARMVVDVRSMIESMPPKHKADIDGDFLTAITAGAHLRFLRYK